MDQKQLPKLSSYRWVILAIISLMDATSSYIQYQISALATQVMPALHIAPAQFQSLLMAPMFIAVFLSIPAGTLGDKYGAKKIVTVGCFVSIIGAYGRLFATNFATMMIMLLLFGVYMALLNANALKIFGSWFKQDTKLAMGVFFASASIGIMLTQLTSHMFPSVKAAYIFSSTLLLILTVCWTLFVKEKPEGEEIPPAQAQQAKPESAMKYFKVVARSGKTWLVGLAGGLGVAASESFSGILPQAFAARGMTPAAGSMIAAIATIGSLCGSLFGPGLINKAKKAKPVMIVFTLIGGGLMALTWYIPLGLPLTIALILGGLFGAMTGPIMNSMPIQFPEVGPKYAGSAGGLVSTVSLLLSSCLPTVIGLIAGRNYEMTFIIQGIFFAITAIIIGILPDANGGRPRK